MSKILIVDDDMDVTRLLSTKFKAQGLDVHCARDGVSCISAAVHNEPDLIVLDLGLPAGDGYKTLQRIRQNDRLFDIPVVVYSAADSEEAEKKCLAEGATAYVQKTDRPDTLIWTVYQVLQGNWPLDA